MKIGTVRELSSRMSSSELSEWIAMAKIEPFGEQRADMRSAVESWASVRAWQKGAKPIDFFLPGFIGSGTAEKTEKVKVLPASQFMAILHSMG